MNWKPMYFQSCPKGLCRCSSLCVKWNSPPLFPPTVLFPFHPHVLKTFNLSLFFLHTSWTETAKKECMQNILRYSVRFSANSHENLRQTHVHHFLFLDHVLRHRFDSFWVTVALFVLCPFVKLFLNVYTWFSNCLFCTFNFIIKQCKLSPWCLEDHIV